MHGDRAAVLLAAGGAGWESRALELLSAPDLVVLKRCVDLPDLLAAATTGRAQVALVSADLPGLDADAVVHLLRHDVRTVTVGEEDLSRLGVAAGVDPAALEGLTAVVREVLATEPVSDPLPRRTDIAEPGVPRGAPGRIVVVWGPAGAPGRTTLAVTLAHVLAERAGRPVVLADLDPYGGAVAQHLGVLDEVSGVLAAARLVNAGRLEPSRSAATRRRVGSGVEVLTGLPRSDRWIEVRAGATTEILGDLAGGAHVVADVGFCLEDETDDLVAGAGRNRMTLEAVAAADQLLVVGVPDAVGLSRLARGLVELTELRTSGVVRVVVNRMRDTLGWGEGDIRGMIEGFARPAGIHFLPEDRTSCDRAMMSGRPIAEGGLRRGVAEVASAVLPDSQGEAPARRRRAGMLRRRQLPRSR